ncbi:macrocin-O-methyltransferase [Flavisolibacter tropicus]|uniref:Macrocin-O-methyltransferase n=1 Tax=Flavisolibacter tropicus TaxID=1492898 RepID=A0A172U2W1_9BACT|nr:macrocin-O-methyltransferase [Flavisolibacter tropicus]
MINEVYQGRGNMDKRYPSDFSVDEIAQIEKVRLYTMTSSERLVSLSRAIEYIHYNNIEGDMVECGVWKGGSMMLAANKLKSLNNTSKSLFLFDTFEGMSHPTDVDVTYEHNSAKELLENQERNPEVANIWCYSTLEEVRANLHSTGYPSEKIHFIKGKVEQTLPYGKINTISLLRLDTDWYESTKHELEILYDRLVSGGVLIIDDYGHWSGARKAVDEFIANRKLKLFLNRVDYTCRLAIKM